MGVWKKDGKKPGAAACSFARLKSARGCGAAMMAISNIERWNAGKGAGDKIDLPRLANSPGTVAHAIQSGEIDLGTARGFLLNEILQLSHCAVDQKARSSCIHGRFGVA